MGAEPAGPTEDAFAAALAPRYTLGRELGRGGMAIVMEARDVRTDRPVAIKRLLEDASDVVAQERFRREIAILGRLAHPHILPLLDSGVDAGRAWYAMPLVSGRSLRDRLARSGALPVDDALALVRDVAAALDHAHGHGVIHRDIKPENLLLDARGQVRVADFGIARVLATGGPTMTSRALTMAGTGLGTLDYASPEQLLGEEVSPASDVYALACVASELLSGAPPFRSQSAQRSLALRLAGTPAPLAEMAPDAAHLAPVLHRALDPDPAARHATAGAFAAALQAVHDAAAGGAAGGARAASVIAGSMDSAAVAVLPFDVIGRAEEAGYLAEGVTEELLHALSRVAGLRVPSRAATRALVGRGGAPPEPARLAAQLHVAQAVHGAVRVAGTQVRVTAELVDLRSGLSSWSATFDRELKDVLTLQEELAGAIVAQLRGRLATGQPRPALARRHSSNPEAYAAYLRGRYHWNRRPRETMRGIQYFKEALALDPDYALAWCGLADCWATVSSWEGGAVAPAEGFPQAIEAARRALALDPTLAEGYTALAYADVHFGGAVHEATAHFDRALTLDPGYAHAHHWSSHLALILGRREESLTASLRALRLEPLDTVINAHLAWHHHFSGAYALAIEQGERTLQLDPDDFWARFFMGLAQEQLGRHGAAMALLDEAATRTGRQNVLLGAYGHCLAAGGNAAEARAVLRELDQRAMAGYASPYERALIHHALGEVEPALARLAEACAVRDGWLPYLRIDPRFRALGDRPEARAIIASAAPRA
ncbi:MAG: protein kinase [Gemmatimonadetes bacterium]|nr:protein kinase [Gemmatimonadota bacterium]